MSFPSIPGYEILELLGQGSMGTVYKARQIALDRFVAIKVLRAELAEQTRYLERLQREAKLTARLDHPHVVKGIDYGVAQGQPYFVMEFAEGNSLKQLLQQRGRFRESDAIEIAMQVAGALENAHRHGIVHRDVKPGNIVLSSDGLAKLTDLGLARRPGDPTVTHTGATMGTPQYISPEQARNPSAVDIRSDIYSLGATLYHLVTGSPPFAGESLADLLTKVLFEQAEAASSRESSVSSGFSLVLRKMLAKDPARRYQTPGELLDDLRRVRAHESPAVDERSLIESAPSRRRVALLAGVLGVVALGLGVGWALQPGSREEAPPRIKERSSVDLESLRPDPGLGSPALIDRLEGMARTRVDASLSPGERATLDTFAQIAQTALRERLRQAVHEESDALLSLAKEKRFLEIAAFWDEGHAEALARRMGVSLARLRSAEPEIAAEWDRWREAEKAGFRAKMKRWGEAFALSAQRFAAKNEPKILDRIQSRQFRQAWNELDAAERFRDEEGSAASDLPWSFGATGSELLDRFAGQMKAKIRAASRELALRIQGEIEAAAKSIEPTIAAGSSRPAAERLEREGAKIFERWKLRAEDLLAADESECSRAIELARLRLAEQEDALRREAAAKVLLDFDQEFAPWLRQREYEKPRREWEALLDRPSLDPVRGEIEARLAELTALLRLRESFGEALAPMLGRTIEIREGAIRKSGRLVKTMDPRNGEFALEPERGPAISTSFAKIHLETVGKICGIVDDKTGQALADLPPATQFAWAIFLFYEGQMVGARPLLEKLARQATSAAAAQSALARLERQERELAAAAKERERRATDGLDAAKRLGLVGEYARAREKYAQTLRDFADAETVRGNRQEIEAEIARLAAEEKDLARAESLRAQFPGASVLPLDEGRLLLRYGFRSGLNSDWRIPESWKLEESGLRRKERCRDAAGFKSVPGPALSLPLSASPGARVSFRVVFPFEEGDPFYASFSVAGHCFGVWSGGEDALAQAAAWTGGLESYEAHFQHPGLGALPADSKRFRFLRGGRYEVAIDLQPGGREAVLRVDGQEIVRSALKPGAELLASLREKIEFRSWERVELREVTIEGVSAAGR